MSTATRPCPAPGVWPVQPTEHARDCRTRPRARPRLPSVVTKKRRRTQLARAGMARQQLRRAERDRRRRRRRTILTIAAVVIAVAALVTFIVLQSHDSG